MWWCYFIWCIFILFPWHNMKPWDAVTDHCNIFMWTSCGLCPRLCFLDITATLSFLLERFFFFLQVFLLLLLLYRFGGMVSFFLCLIWLSFVHNCNMYFGYFFPKKVSLIGWLQLFMGTKERRSYSHDMFDPFIDGHLDEWCSS